MGGSLGKAAFVVFELLLAAHIGAGEFGLYSLSLSLLLICASLSLVGLNYGVVRYLAIFQDENNDIKVRRLVQWSVIGIAVMSTATAGVVVTFADSIADSVFGKPELAPALVLVGFAIPFEALNQGIGSLFRGLRQGGRDVLITDTLRNLLLLLVIPAVWFYSFSSIQIILLVFVGTFLTTIWGFVLLARTVPKLHLISLRDWTILLDVLRFSYLLFFWNMLQITVTRSSIVIAGIFLSNQEVGIFSMFLRLSLLLVFFQSAINRTIFVEFSSLLYRQAKELLAELYESTSTLLLITTVVFSLPLIVYPLGYMHLIGTEYLPYAWWLSPLVWAYIAEVGTGPIGQLLVASEKQVAILLLSLCGSLLQLLLSFLLIPRWGVAGAVMAQTITMLFMTIIRHLFSKYTLGIHFLTRRFFVFCSFGGASFGIGAGLALLLPQDYPMTVWAGASLVAWVIFGVLLHSYTHFDAAFHKQSMMVTQGMRRVLGVGLQRFRSS